VHYSFWINLGFPKTMSVQIEGKTMNIAADKDFKTKKTRFGQRETAMR